MPLERILNAPAPVLQMGQLRHRSHIGPQVPPMMAGDDVMAVLPNIDCVLMVVGNGNSTRSEIEESMRHISADRLLGVVLNKAEAATRQGYY